MNLIEIADNNVIFSFGDLLNRNSIWRSDKCYI